MEYADCNGTRLAYEVHGEGEEVLLIMGLAARATAWENQYRGLAGRFRVARFDNRGIGASAPLARRRTSIREMADDALGLLDHLGWDRAHIVGVSMGGMIAQELALAARERVRSLSLIATHPGGSSFVPPAAGRRNLLRTQIGPLQRRRAMLARVLYPPEYIEEHGEDKLLQRMAINFGDGPPPPRTMVAQLLAVMGHNTAARLERLEGLPTLVVQPARDMLIDPTHSETLERLIPGARRATVHDAGHGVLHQRPDVVNHLLIEHFEGAGDEEVAAVVAAARGAAGR